MPQDVWKDKKAMIEEVLSGLLHAENPAHRTLYESMNYSLLAGGKRIRPALFLRALDAMGVKPAGALTVAAAIECVHTYSLIHDDLPQMDNDDYRRGRPTNHKVYGAGMATMAGDGLLTEAFRLIAGEEMIAAPLRCELISILAKAAGPSGMVGGQAIDIESEGKLLSAGELRFMDACKTGSLLTAPVDMAAVLAETDAETKAALHDYASHLGILFQITDDLLDSSGDLKEMGKAPGMDAAMHKSTYVTILGKEKAEALAKEEAEAALSALSCFVEKVEPLRDLISFILHRTK